MPETTTRTTEAQERVLRAMLAGSAPLAPVTWRTIASLRHRGLITRHGLTRAGRALAEALVRRDRQRAKEEGALLAAWRR